jgi:hypothetical protein
MEPNPGPSQRVAARWIKGLQMQCQRYCEARTHATAELKVDEGDLKSIVVYLRIRNEPRDGVPDEYVVSLDLSKPFGAPVVRYLTPNPVFKTGVPVCIDGWSHYHPESWDATSDLDIILDAVAAPLLSPWAAMDVQGAVGAL